MPTLSLSSKATLTILCPPAIMLLHSFTSLVTMLSHSLTPRGCSYANFIISRESAGNRSRRHIMIIYGSARKLSPSDASTSASCSVVDVNDLHTSSQEENDIVQTKIGSKVRVKVPLKVYHVPRVLELVLTGMEGQLKQYVAVWKGKFFFAYLPYKVEFITQVEGRGLVKFFAHLKEGEFEYI